MAENVALFVDVQTLHHQLRTHHHRPIDPALLLECAREHGELDCSVAVADWESLPSDYKESFQQEEFELVQVDRRTHTRESGGRRREVLRDVVDLELLARMVEVLHRESGVAIDKLVFATGDVIACRTVALMQETFEKEVGIIGVEGAVPEELQELASSWETLPMPPIEPKDLDGLKRLVPLLEQLEKRKRYLNFKYIRETVARRVDFEERPFEGAERLLSEAIACDLLLKRKIEDKYNPGQMFTAYALNRDSDLFDKFGSGEPAPVHEDPPEKEEAPAKAPASEEPAPQAGGKEEAPRKRRRRRRRRGSSGNNSNNPSSPPAEAPGPMQLSAGSNRRRRRRKGQGSHHHQDRVGRAYEAPSRFLADLGYGAPRKVDDDDIDEDRILRALGDL